MALRASPPQVNLAQQHRSTLEYEEKGANAKLIEVSGCLTHPDLFKA